MNHDPLPFENPAHEREWQAQERALRAERLGLDASSGDGRLRRYRLLARALREPVPPALPDDFARQMAVRVAGIPAREEADDSRFDYMLVGALVVALTGAAAVVTIDHGRAWLTAFSHLLPATASSSASEWLLALGGCVVATWLLGLRPARRTAD